MQGKCKEELWYSNFPHPHPVSLGLLQVSAVKNQTVVEA